MIYPQQTIQRGKTRHQGESKCQSASWLFFFLKRLQRESSIWAAVGLTSGVSWVETFINSQHWLSGYLEAPHAAKQ